MKIKTLTDSKEIIQIDEYLKLNGVEDIYEYLHPTNKYIESPYLHTNMVEAVQLFKYHYLNKDLVYILCDSGDCDGITSTCILYKYMRRLNHKWKIKIGIHTGKQRGLQDEDLLNDILEKKPSLVIIPDSGTNDKEQAEILRDNDISLLVLDHHQLKTPIEYGTLINNQVGDVDHYGSGCAETFMFLRALDIEFNHKWANDYIDLVGLSTISDSMNVTSQQNRKYIAYGLLNPNNIKNGLLWALFEEKGLFDKDYNQRDIAFSIVPLINAVCRSDEQELKQKMILGFLGKYDIDEVVDLMKKAHSHQTYVVNKFVGKYEFDDDSKFNIYISDDLPRSYSGLIAQKIMCKNGRPTIVGKDKDGSIIGSCRSTIDIREELDNNEYVDFANGHSQAFGIGLQSENLQPFIESLDSLNLSSEPYIDVLQSWSIKSIPKRLYGLYEPYNELWGHGLQNPLFHVDNISISSNDINIVGKNQDTARIKYKDVTIIIFHLTDVDKERLLCYNKSTRLNLQVVGNLTLNEWHGKHYPQIVVDKFEINEINHSLDDLL